MSKLLSIDVGMKNLGFCLIQYENSDKWNILKWDVLNLCEEKQKYCCHQMKGGICNKLAKYKKGDFFCCKKHATKFIIPTSELNIIKIKKLKVKDLYALLEKYDIPYDKKKNKNQLLDDISNYIKENCYEAITSIKADEINLIEIGRTMKQKFDVLFACDMDLDKVVIENQISPIANRMKTLQGMITQYFIMKTNSDIEFMSSENKLKLFDEKKSSYNDRKKLGIEKTKEILMGNNLQSEWLNVFEKHKKKDDLSDSFLQGLYYIQNK